MYDLAVIVPVRRGSSRIADKSMLPFGDQDSLIAWKLSQLVRVIPPERIYLSTEDEGFAAIGDGFGVSRHKRSDYLSIGHQAPFRDVITGIVRDIPHEHIAWCTVVCPLMPPSEYLESFRAYHAQVIRGTKDSLVGINMAKEYFWSPDGALNYSATRDHTISQELPDWTRVTNSIYMSSKSDILTREYFLGPNPVQQQLCKLSGVDIDYIEDYRIARALYAVYAEDGMGGLERGSGIDWTVGPVSEPAARAA
ncbi:MAG: acylneuraminate cytidylyltransferase [Pseudomonadota bacterium]